MSNVCVAGPDVLAVDLDDAKLSLRLELADTAMDGLVTIWTEGIIAALESEIGQCLMEQTWEVRLDEFPVAISLPHPVISVTSVIYLDVAGDEQTLDEDAYRLNQMAYGSTLTPISGTCWPDTYDETGAVTVTVVCGYGDTPAATPKSVKLYILAKLSEQFDPATRMERDTVQSAFVTRLLDACRSY